MIYFTYPGEDPVYDPAEGCDDEYFEQPDPDDRDDWNGEEVLW